MTGNYESIVSPIRTLSRILEITVRSPSLCPEGTSATFNYGVQSRLDFEGGPRKVFVSFLPLIGNQCRRLLNPPHDTRPLGVRGSPEGTNWGLKSSTLKSIYYTVIRNIEYSFPVSAPAANTAKPKIGSLEYRVSKVLIITVSSTNNSKAKLESGLVS
ncbi:hypothetical protein TNCV_2531711 [Trichonephila clavipes]|nr:hypothetical protein TNCV_2531711 [Trichonephila clavipes]